MIVIFGVPGCGKSALIDSVKQEIPSLQVMNYGDKMLEVANLQRENRDQLRKMPADRQKEIGLQAAKNITQASTGITLLDTHALIRSDVGYVPGLPKAVLECLSPKAYVMIECSPAKILHRRAQDVRQRDTESEEELALHQELSRSFLTACSLMTGSLICRIDNTSDFLRQNAQPLITLIQSL